MVLWNGPLGAFEYKPFDYATSEIAKCINRNTNKKKQNFSGGELFRHRWGKKTLFPLLYFQQSFTVLIVVHLLIGGVIKKSVL